MTLIHSKHLLLCRQASTAKKKKKGKKSQRFEGNMETILV